MKPLILTAVLMAACLATPQQLGEMTSDQLVRKLTAHKKNRGSLMWNYSPQFLAQIRATYVLNYGQNWDPQFQADVRQGWIRIGMTKEMALASWGRPSDINRTVGSWGVHEQWVYSTSPAYGSIPSNYLYFENGILTTYQT